MKDYEVFDGNFKAIGVVRRVSGGPGVALKEAKGRWPFVSLLSVAPTTRFTAEPLFSAEDLRVLEAGNAATDAWEQGALLRRRR